MSSQHSIFTENAGKRSDMQHKHVGTFSLLKGVPETKTYIKSWIRSCLGSFASQSLSFSPWLYKLTQVGLPVKPRINQGRGIHEGAGKWLLKKYLCHNLQPPKSSCQTASEPQNGRGQLSTGACFLSQI